MLKKMIRKRFGYPTHYEITSIKFPFQKAAPGKMFRECAVTYSPVSYPPYTHENWDRKVCAVVIFGLAVMSFVVKKPVTWRQV